MIIITEQVEKIHTKTMKASVHCTPTPHMKQCVDFSAEEKDLRQ